MKTRGKQHVKGDVWYSTWNLVPACLLSVHGWLMINLCIIKHGSTIVRGSVVSRNKTSQIDQQVRITSMVSSMHQMV